MLVVCTEFRIPEEEAVAPAPPTTCGTRPKSSALPSLATRGDPRPPHRPDTLSRWWEGLAGLSILTNPSGHRSPLLGFYAGRP